MNKFKEYTLPMVAFVLILLTVWANWVTREEHHAFFHDVRHFMSKGGRNTADDGYNLCVNINQLIESAGTGQKPLDCAARYKTGE